MSKEEKITVVIHKHSKLGSLICDLQSMSLIVITYWINYKFIDGNDFVDVFLLIFIFCYLAGDRGCRNEYSVTDKQIEQINKFLKEKGK